ncbi:MAG TPA: FxsA family protein [Candidatus Thermoplasmatota archaeon]|nr:FxsA family protein [Candidatus Thermoplasmatota archaeon]
MLGLLVLLLLIADIASLAYLSDVMRLLGWESWQWWYGFLYALAFVFIGIWTMKLGGAWSAMKSMRAMQEGRIPGREMLDGLFYLSAGVLFMTPGWVSDVLAVALLFPLTRWPVRALVIARFRRRVLAQQAAEEPRVIEVNDFKVE